MAEVMTIDIAGFADPDGATVRWAVEHLAETLRARGVDVVTGAPGGGQLGIVVAEREHADREAFVLARPDGPADPVLVEGAGPGATYGVLELADIVTYAENPVEALRGVRPQRQVPATPVRSVIRAFMSVDEDLPWFHDDGFWDEYLTELATNRVNRLQLAFGMQFNFGHNPVSENYFCFPYPFLLDVPGYDVRVENLSDTDRDRNLASLRRISDEAKKRGIQFQLGLWNHAYDQTLGGHEYDNAQENRPYYPISGLTESTHAAYCGSALAELLRSCPSIDGLTLRVHYEGGVPDETRTEFWRRTLAGLAAVGRRIEIDMHAKGVDEPLVAVARATGQPVVLSTKYWGEHIGLPYHQAGIREKERVPVERPERVRAITGFERSFTRYGYGDFLRADRDFDVLYRIWPGGQRVLLWGDPLFAAGYGRQATFCGAIGAELFEPLSFKGRKATGTSGGRDPYADPDLRLGDREWRKYRYTYRLWGRLLYDPDAAPDGWRRLLAAEFGEAAEPLEQALGAASRIVPLVTVAHAPGASISNYWPEMYVDMPIVDGPYVEHYAGDAGVRSFGAVSAFDPVLFCGPDEHAAQLVAGTRDGRYTPSDVAGWLESLAAEADRQLSAAVSAATDPKATDFRRWSADVSAQAGLGRFFAGKFRAAVGYALWRLTTDPRHVNEAVSHLRDAADAFRAVVAVTRVYRDDLTFGHRLAEHGHWADRLPAVEQDLANLEALADRATFRPSEAKPLPPAPSGPRTEVLHEPVAVFEPGRELTLEVRVPRDFRGSVYLRYRQLNHREEYRSAELQRDGEVLRATVPSSDTSSPFHLGYFFVVREPSGDAWISPGLDAGLANQPYHVARRGGGDARRSG
jgi:hypothetical protein